MSTDTIRGVLTVGLLAGLVARAQARARCDQGYGWDDVLRRIEALAEAVADRPVIESDGFTRELRPIVQQLLNRWPDREARGVHPLPQFLALIGLAEAIVEEIQEAVAERAERGADVRGVLAALSVVDGCRASSESEGGVDG